MNYSGNTKPRSQYSWEKLQQQKERCGRLLIVLTFHRKELVNKRISAQNPQTPEAYLRLYYKTEIELLNISNELLELYLELCQPMN